jgi:hypothetical protein
MEAGGSSQSGSRGIPLTSRGLMQEDQLWRRDATLQGEKETEMSFALSMVNVWMMRSKDHGRTMKKATLFLRQFIKLL